MTETEAVPNTSVHACPGCGGETAVPFFEVRDVPVDVGHVRSTRQAALQAARGDLQLCHCGKCGLVHNAAFDPTRIRFEPGYEVALHHSETFRAFVDELATRLIDRFRLQGRRVLDIGCGGGYFLEALARLGGVHGTGVDPSVVCEGQREIGSGSTYLIRDFWSAKYADRMGDLIACQSVFEDIQDPLQFLRDLRAMIGDRNTPLYWEVFNGFRAFEQQETWSIHYEQCNYFHLDCLCRIMSLAGFQPLRSGSCYQGDQYLYVEAVPSEVDFQTPAVMRQRAATPSSIRDFEVSHRQRVHLWNERMATWQAERREVAIWGSGGKAVNFLHSVETGNVVRRVVDINPDRQNKYMPGSGLQIVSPLELTTEPVDIVIVMNQLYEEEIRRQVSQLGVTCDVFVA